LIGFIMRRRYKIVLTVLLVLVVAVSGFIVWAETPLGPMSEALEALESDSYVVVTKGKWLVFRPAQDGAEAGFIMYPGGRVDYRSYAPVARGIAAEGYLVVIVRMPLNLAVFGSGAARDVLSAFPEVDAWAVGGHSLGGSMAARFVYRNPSAVDGLILWASYPASGDDLSDRDIAVATIYGTKDGLATYDKIERSLGLLPLDALIVGIDGGNHAQFGSYGPQGGDDEASITREQQQSQIIEATFQLLRKIT
jgi:dienelactone hydrolase